MKHDDYYFKKAMLNFVAGKNILVPSERGTRNEANTMCAGQGMELMDLKSITEMDSVQDFLGGIGSFLYTTHANSN
jgi:hypothetical protein